MEKPRAWKTPDSLILETRVRDDCSTDPCWSLQALIHSRLRFDSTSFSAMCGSVASVSHTDLQAACMQKTSILPYPESISQIAKSGKPFKNIAKKVGAMVHVFFYKTNSRNPRFFTSSCGSCGIFAKPEENLK